MRHKDKIEALGGGRTLLSLFLNRKRECSNTIPVGRERPGREIRDEHLSQNTLMTGGDKAKVKEKRHRRAAGKRGRFSYDFPSGAHPGGR